MLIQRKFMWLGLNGCLYCGSYFPRDGGLCKTCADSLWRWTTHEELYYQTVSKLQVTSLFEWVPGLQEVLSRLVRSLKGSAREDLWQYYAEEFWIRYLVSNSVRRIQNLVLIPSPSRRGERDHAMQFALAIAQLSGAEVRCCLVRAGHSSAQKNLSRKQRFGVRFDWAENITAEQFQRETSGKRVIFIDDVLTTGATARSAWSTLGKPKEFAVWTLVQRSLSCGESGDLL